MSQRTLGLRVAGTVFGVVAAGYFAGGLCIWLWRLSRE
jgi:hypothetical protein